MRGLQSLLILACLVGALFAQVYEKNLPLDHPSIAYSKGPVDDRVSRLTLKLQFRRGGLGYLPSLLEALDVREDSQALVFSKSGLQSAKTSPRTPRAIYFNDDVAVGFVQGGDTLEVAAQDPRQGTVFYTLDAAESQKPRLVRRENCLQCHQGPATAGVPGMYVSSVYTSSIGTVYFSLGTIVTDHRTAFEDRWGGWYVTGTHGAQKHRGNAIADNPADPRSEGTQNLTSLTLNIDTSKYLAPTSDIVALMVFEHQTQMLNLFTRLGWQARMGTMDSASIDEVVRYMTFEEETKLKEPIVGVSTFTQTFPRRGPRDSKGRSLRDLDLKTRLFKYPLSFMIYSEPFDALPANVRTEIMKRLTARLAPEVLEILRGTGK